MFEYGAQTGKFFIADQNVTSFLTSQVALEML
jgi:hypothetical protein